MAVATVTSKGQVTFPEEVREDLDGGIGDLLAGDDKRISREWREARQADRFGCTEVVTLDRGAARTLGMRLLA